MAPSAISERPECPTDGIAVVGRQCSHPGREEAPADRLEVVEARYALDTEAVARSQRQLGRDVANGPGDGSDDDRGEHGDGFSPGDDQDRPTLVLRLGPPDLALTGYVGHQGSS